MQLFDRLKAAIASLDFSRLAPMLADDVRFESCLGRAQVAEFLGRLFSGGVTARLVDFEVLPDRAIARLDLLSPHSDPFGPGRQARYAVMFLRNDQVVELQVVEDSAQALAAVQSSPPPPPPQTRTALQSSAAVLPVRELAGALEHYRRLGFSVSSYDGGGYGYAERDGVHLHLNVVAGLHPPSTTSAVYLYVQDADSLYAEWRSAGVSGQFFEPHDTEYGLREGAHVDRDGNLLRFGSAMRDRDQPGATIAAERAARAD